MDRKKHIFKLSQGEYVAPERIEAVYARNPWIGNIFIHGDSMRPYLVALVVPAPDKLTAWAKEKGIEGDVAALCANPKVKEAITSDLFEFGKANGLHGFEMPRDVLVSPTPFTIDNGMSACWLDCRCD